MSTPVVINTHTDANKFISEWLNWLANELEGGLAWDAEGCTIQNIGGRLVAKAPEGWDPDDGEDASISMTIKDWRTAIDNARKAASYIGSIQVIAEPVSTASQGEGHFRLAFLPEATAAIRLRSTSAFHRRSLI